MSSKFDVIAAIQFYIDKMVNDPSIGGVGGSSSVYIFPGSFMTMYSGMKALILDPMTTKIVSMVYSQTQILENSVYLVEMIGADSEPMLHAHAIFFIQPTEINLTLLTKEIQHPRFSDYHIFYSNIVSADYLTSLAEEDVNEVIKQVQEYYGDFIPINEDFFQLGAVGILSLSSTIRNLRSDQIFERNVNGLLSVLLATKRRPCQVRCQASSDVARRVANEVSNRIEHDGIYVFQSQGPILLILDRRDDPITPLLIQWTYQAMVHELLGKYEHVRIDMYILTPSPYFLLISCKGLNYNRVVLKNVPNIKPELEEVVLSCTQDKFFSRNRYANFGDLGSAVKTLVGEYQRVSKTNEKINSIEDMRRLMANFTDIRSQALLVSKLVTIVSELARLTDACHLLDISQLEQEIACANDHSAHKKQLIQFLLQTTVQQSDKLRLSILYALKYESYNEVNELKARLAEVNVPPPEINKLTAMLNYAGENYRAPGLFNGGNSANLVDQFFQKAFVNVNGVENVYTQHQPLLYSIIDNFAKNRYIKDTSYPNVMNNQNPGKPTELLVFIVGGATFEEATKVAEFNAANQGVRVTLGGSYVHNSNSFLKEVASSFS